jgi:catechol 2,3-dioxygenase-like lactoylglutathione lyase family enzyme
MNASQQGVPALVFSHFGVYCHDVAALEDFYTRVMGFAVSDCGHVHAGPVEFDMSFMTRRPWEHHQLVIAGGRAKEATAADLSRMYQLTRKQAVPDDLVKFD